jgi:hypothetical protein
MRHQELRGVAVILAAVMACTLLPWVWAQGVGPLIPGQGLADISLGSRIAEIVARLGAPNEVRLASTDGTLAYTFDQYGIAAYARGNTIIALTTTNSLLGMIRGVGLGSSRESIVAMFGTPRSVGLVEGFPGLLYDTQGIAFGLDRHTVAVVMIFKPVASPVQPASPTTPSSPTTPAVTSQADESDDMTAGVSGAGIPAAAAPVASAPAAPAAPAPAPAALVQTATSGDLPGASSRTDIPALTPSAEAAPVTTIPENAAPVGASVLPDLGRLHPFTVDTRFLSLAGYLRYFIYGMTRQWIGPKVSNLVIRLHEDATGP